MDVRVFEIFFSRLLFYLNTERCMIRSIRGCNILVGTRFLLMFWRIMMNFDTWLSVVCAVFTFLLNRKYRKKKKKKKCFSVDWMLFFVYFVLKLGFLQLQYSVFFEHFQHYFSRWLIFEYKMWYLKVLRLVCVVYNNIKIQFKVM